jgi:NhaP-type Na+/H+ or K+/H+ antiporter
VRLKRFCIDDPTIQTMLSLLTPYAAYLAAEWLSVSAFSPSSRRASTPDA